MQLTQIDFIARYFAQENVLLVQNYFSQVALIDINKDLLQAEISKLFQQVSNFNDEKLANTDYLAIFAEILPEVLMENEEEAILQKIVPYWQKLRGNAISAEKPIDEFYYELELLVLWVLLFDTAYDKEQNIWRIQKMRNIIRRYSNMPQMWLLLYQHSGEEVSTLYTF